MEINDEIRSRIKGKLEGKVIGITGGGSGLGKAMALGVAAAGGNLALLGRREDTLRGAVAECEAEGVQAAAVVADVTSEESVTNAVAEIDRTFRRLDGWINNAGIVMENIRRDFPLDPIKFSEITVDAWRQIVDVDLNGPFICLRYAVPLMEKSGGGSVLNITTAKFIFEKPGYLPYGPAKLALVALTRGLAEELGPVGIRLNAMNPGAPAYSEQVLPEIFPEGMIIMQPTMMIPPTVYLMSDDSIDFTGQFFAAREWNIEQGITLEEAPNRASSN